MTNIKITPRYNRPEYINSIQYLMEKRGNSGTEDQITQLNFRISQLEECIDKLLILLLNKNIISEQDILSFIDDYLPLNEKIEIQR